MDKIQLDRRDRKALTREDAENVFTTACKTEGPTPWIDPIYKEAIDHLDRTGERVAYVVIRVER